jgi:hypothetical protein
MKGADAGISARPLPPQSIFIKPICPSGAALDLFEGVLNPFSPAEAVSLQKI